jgi:hypothetical protein
MSLSDAGRSRSVTLVAPLRARFSDIATSVPLAGVYVCRGLLHHAVITICHGDPKTSLVVSTLACADSIAKYLV